MDAKTRIIELTETLNRYRDSYYNKSVSIVSDQEYDRLFDELDALEKENSFKLANSPTCTVGYAVNDALPKVLHKRPLLSLNKTKNVSYLLGYFDTHDFIIMHKLDGLTISIEYEHGKLKKAATRGNGEVGSLITDNVKTFLNVPLEIPFKDKLVVVGEGLILENDFKEINDKLPDDEKYKTPRNLASGSVQNLDSSVCAKRRVRFYCFNAFDGTENIPTLSGRLDFVKSLGFDTVSYWHCQKMPDLDEKALEVIIDSIRRTAFLKHIPIDGLVFKFDDVKYGESLGKTKHHYKDGIALKFQEEEEESIVRDIEWQVGRTGKITPVAVFDPVELEGTTVAKASVHNLGVLTKLNVQIGSKVTVVKKNEIIPQIIKASGGSGYVKSPGFCPVCGKPTRIAVEGDITELFCDNPDCMAKHIANLVYFCSKECMDIDGLSEKTIEKFVSEGLIHNIFDIYSLNQHHDKIVDFDGMGENSYNNLINAIEKSRNVKFENFVAALGIPKIALAKAKILGEKFDHDWQKFISAVKNGFDFTELDTFGAELNKNIYEFMENSFFAHDYYEKLANHMNFIKPDKPKVAQTMSGKVICITGTLNHVSRKELQKMVENAGGKVTDSVSRKTNYLVNNDLESQSSKNMNAKKFGVDIVSEDDFLNILKGEK